MRRIISCCIALLVFSLQIFGNEDVKTVITANDYISTYKSKAVKEMLLYKIPASIILGQGMLESGNGNSNLARNAKNHFGIKCHKEWTGPTFIMDDDEKNECFRKYDDVQDSYTDHSMFLTSRPRYASLFTLPKNDYTAWAKGLKSAGYATHPRYAEMLIEVIEKNRLYELDTITDWPHETNINIIVQAEKKKFELYKMLSVKTREFLELIKQFDINLLKEERVAERGTKEVVVAYPQKEIVSVGEHILQDANGLTAERKALQNEIAAVQIKQINLNTLSANFYAKFERAEMFKVMTSSTEFTGCKNTELITKCFSLQPESATDKIIFVSLPLDEIVSPAQAEEPILETENDFYYYDYLLELNTTILLQVQPLVIPF